MEFLEGYSAEEAAASYRARAGRPAWAEFAKMQHGDNLENADCQLAFEGYLWQRYRERFFSLFDMRQPERWEEFRRFLRCFYEMVPDQPAIVGPLSGMKAQGRPPWWGIPPWNVC